MDGQSVSGSPSTATDKPPARPTAKSAETRARIIEGALVALEEHGIGAATTRRIASGAGVQLATLHYHFDSKEDLLMAVLLSLNAEMVALARREIASLDDGDVRLEALIRSFWRHLAATRATQIVQLELTLYALRTRGSEWLAARQYDAYIDVYRELLADRLGLPEREAAAVSAALGRFILGGLDGLILQSLAMRDEAALEKGLDALVVASRDYLHRLTEEARR